MRDAAASAMAPLRLVAARRRWDLPGALMAVVIAIVTGLLIYGAADTSGFLTVSNLKAILTATSLVGIISVGMTAIMISGNLFSLSVGQTAAVTATMFLYALRVDLTVAIAAGIALGLGIGAVQGGIVGFLGANTIIITIGAGLLQEGLATWMTNGNSVVPPSGSSSYTHLALPLFGVPFAIYVFFTVAIVAEFVLRKTRFGRQLYLMGENRSAAHAAGLPTALLTTGAFALAGACTGLAGVLIGAASANGSLLLEGTYTYDAIAATLVGGNAVGGGRGSVARTVVGALFIATISDLLLLRGYSTGIQILVKGIIVAVVVVLTNLRRGR
jgi:simple sugar transport system permease protein/ribose transport system permease protein